MESEDTAILKVGMYTPWNSQGVCACLVCVCERVFVCVCALCLSLVLWNGGMGARGMCGQTAQEMFCLQK